MIWTRGFCGAATWGLRTAIVPVWVPLSTAVHCAAMTDSTNESLAVGPDDAGRRLDVFLAERLALSRTGARRLLASGAVRIDGRLAAEGDKGLALSAGERVEVAASAADAQRIPLEPDADLSVLAHGPRWLVADQPAGVAVQP